MNRARQAVDARGFGQIVKVRESGVPLTTATLLADRAAGARLRFNRDSAGP